MDHNKEIAEIWAIIKQTNLLQQQKTVEQFALWQKQSQEADRRSQEADRRSQDADRRSQDADRRSQDADRRFQETDRRFQETDRRFQETDRQFQETKQLLKEERLETERQFRETERLLKEDSQKTDEQMRRTDQRINQLYGTFSNQWGRLIEALVKPDAVRLFQERGIKIIGANTRMERHRDGETMELDLILLNSEELVVIEVKSSFSQGEVVEFLADLGEFNRFFPEYKNYRVYGAIAGLELPSDVGRYAYRQGLFVVVVSGQGIVAIKNDAKFRPKNFGS